jgi:hypothetical protein
MTIMTDLTDTNEFSTLFEVFFIDANTGWALVEYTIENHYQIGDAKFGYHRRDAIDLAKKLDADKPVRIFGRDGRIQKTIIGH